MTDAVDRVLQDLPGVVSILVLGAVFLSWYFELGVTVLVAGVGFLVVVPLVAIFGDALREVYRSRDEEGSDDGTTDEQQAALAELRTRYARGDIDEAEFERRVKRLLETESVEDAEAFLGGEGDGDSAAEREPTRE